MSEDLHGNTQERRQSDRVSARFVVSYRRKGTRDNFDLSQTGNFSQGGILLTTSYAFDRGDSIEMKIMLPLLEDSIELSGTVEECVEVAEGCIYNTRVRFDLQGEEIINILNRTVEIAQKGK